MTKQCQKFPKIGNEPENEEEDEEEVAAEPESEPETEPEPENGSGKEEKTDPIEKESSEQVINIIQQQTYRKQT